MRARGVMTLASVMLTVGLAVGAAACSSDDSDSPSTTAPATTATTVPATTATTAGTTSTTAPPTTQAPPPPPTAAPTSAGLTPPPGSPCALGSNPNCIDPLGTGQGVYLIGGAECIATSPDPALCTDLDGDGIAGYPDSG